MHSTFGRLMSAFSTNMTLFASRTPLDGLSDPAKANATHVMLCLARRGGVIPSDEIDQLLTEDHSMADVWEGVRELLAAGLMDVGVAGNSFHLTFAGERQAGSIGQSMLS